MTLDLSKAAIQLQEASGRFLEQRRAKLAALAQAVGHFQSADAQDVERRRTAGRTTFLAAGVDGTLVGTAAAPALPADHIVIAVDGSHIDVDRHGPVRCSLVNIGRVSLRYGELPEAALWSEPTLFTEHHELVLRDPSGTREQPIEGPLLGVLRAVMELEALADLAEESEPGLPLLALMDGSLVLWGLAGQVYPDYVRRALLEERFLPAMERLRAMATRRLLAVAAHISLPRSTDVVNAVRISREVCRHEQVDCDHNCGAIPRGLRNCDTVADVTDAELFHALLQPAERSPLYSSTSSIVESYGEHAVRFCYVHLGEEVARLELPAWVSEEAVAFAHAALLAQAAKGHGYPVALQEAHEQAVVNGADRDYFAQLLREMLANERLPDATSQKARSKRTRWV